MTPLSGGSISQDSRATGKWEDTTITDQAEERKMMPAKKFKQLNKKLGKH